jgi:23S rRNA (cytidine1920-2'-O)/16S rRNA (cytidine1409-2'-O)-methyltransferase
MSRVRLDRLVVQRGLAESGHKAQALLLAGLIRAPGLGSLKPGSLVSEDQPLELVETLRYVSRGGNKLEGALRHFSIDVRGKICLDIGASTGGFTDCLLQAGAEKVIAVDVGHGQLHWKLRRDPRVVNLEKTHVLTLAKSGLGPRDPKIVTVDVSFISLEKVLPHVASLIEKGTTCLALVKPQFEAGPRRAPKGVVRDPVVHAEVLGRLKELLPGWGLTYLGEIESPLKGPKGNTEFFIHCEKA